MSAFEICTGCTRHVRASDSACPFCGAKTTTARASLPSWVGALVAGSMLVGVACDGDKAKPAPPAKSDTKAKADDAKADDAKAETGAAKPVEANGDGAKANETGGQDTSRPVDDGATADPDAPPEPKRKPKYGLARPSPHPKPRPSPKYGGPPRPDLMPEPLPEPLPEPAPKPPAK